MNWERSNYAGSSTEKFCGCDKASWGNAHAHKFKIDEPLRGGYVPLLVVLVGCHKQFFCQSTSTTTETLCHHVGNYRIDLLLPFNAPRQTPARHFPSRALFAKRAEPKRVACRRRAGNYMDCRKRRARKMTTISNAAIANKPGSPTPSPKPVLVRAVGLGVMALAATLVK